MAEIPTTTIYPGDPAFPAIEMLMRENANLKRLVGRLTLVAEDLAAGLSDPGSEALAAIYCGRNLIYG